MITPGQGADCKRVNPKSGKSLSPLHYHCDGAGVVIAFYGDQESCVDYRKARVSNKLQRGETV